jgi:GPI mannosyltransferase 3
MRTGAAAGSSQELGKFWNEMDVRPFNRRLRSLFSVTLPLSPLFAPDPGKTVQAPPSRGEVAALLAIVAVGFALRFLLAELLPNVHHPDELFQYLEQGHRFAFGYGVVPWEFRAGTRSWLLPGFLGSLMWLTAALGGGAAAYLAVIAGVLSALSLSIVLVAWLWARRLAGPAAALLAAAVAATWFELVYFGSKPLTEALASASLFAGAYLLWSAARPARGALVAGGLLLGLTVVLRLQLAPAILVVALVGCFRVSLAGWLICAAGGALVVAAAGMLDWVTWGHPFQSFWANLQVNLMENKASQFGVSPWYGYVGQYLLIWSGFTIPAVILILVGARRAPLLLIVPLLIVVSHSFIGHKEYRFVFPAVPFVLLLAAIGTADLVEAVKRVWPGLGGRALVLAAMGSWAATSAILMIGDHFRPNLTKTAAALAGFSDLRGRPSICGIGLVSIPWYYSGGYTYLHRNVPIYPLYGTQDLAETWGAFDVALAQKKDAALLPLGYRRARCYSDTVCVFVRSGSCAARPDRTVNAYLRRSKQ